MTPFSRKRGLLLNNLSSLCLNGLDSLGLSLGSLIALTAAFALFAGTAASLILNYLDVSSLSLLALSLLLLVTAASDHRYGSKSNCQHKNLLHNSESLVCNNNLNAANV